MNDADTLKANTKGFTHIAFSVDDIKATAEFALKKGAAKVGEYTEKEILGAGIVTFWYISDPEGNIVELQSWKYD